MARAPRRGRDRPGQGRLRARPGRRDPPPGHHRHAPRGDHGDVRRPRRRPPLAHQPTPGHLRPGGPHRTGRRRRLRRAGRLPWPGAGPLALTRRGRPRGDDLRPAGPRRGRFRHRPQVGDGADRPGTDPLRRRQRRRGRQRYLRRPDAPRGRPAVTDRGDDHRRVCRRRPRGLRLCPQRVPPRRRDAAPGRRGRSSAGVARPGHRGERVRLRHRGPGRRGGLHLRRGDLDAREPGGPAWRGPRQAADPGAGGPVRDADGGQQRPHPRQCPGDPRRRGRGVRRATAPASPEGPRSSSSRGTSARAGSSRPASGSPCERSSRTTAAAR